MRRATTLVGIVLIALMGLPALALAQATTSQAKPEAAPATSPVEGRWEGTIETPEGAASAVADLKLDGGTIKGTMTAGQYAVSITGGTLQGETVTMSFDVGGMVGSMTATLKDGVLAGTWTAEGGGGGFTLKRIAAATTPAAPPAGGEAQPAAAAAATTAAGGDPITGEWDAVADAGGQQMAFTLSFKLDGEKVTGTISSEQGGGPFEGTFKDNAVSFSFATPNGAAISMVAKLADGKLEGTLDMAGQFQTGWAATKRK